MAPGEDGDGQTQLGCVRLHRWQEKGLKEQLRRPGFAQTWGARVCTGPRPLSGGSVVSGGNPELRVLMALPLSEGHKDRWEAPLA